MRLAVVRERRGNDLAVARARAFLHHLLEHHLERIARLQIVAEVDVAAEDFGEADRELNLLAGGIHRGDERIVLRVDRAAHRDERALLAVRHHLGGEHRVWRRGRGCGRRRRGRDADLEEAVGINLIAEGAQPAVERQLDLIGMMRLQIANVEDARQGLQKLRAMLRPDAMRRQNLRQRRVRRHLRRDRRQLARQLDVVRADRARLRRGPMAGRCAGGAGNQT